MFVIWKRIAYFNFLRTTDENRGLKILIEHVDGVFIIDQVIDHSKKERFIPNYNYKFVGRSKAENNLSSSSSFLFFSHFAQQYSFSSFLLCWRY